MGVQWTRWGMFHILIGHLGCTYGNLVIYLKSSYLEIEYFTKNKLALKEQVFGFLYIDIGQIVNLLCNFESN